MGEIDTLLKIGTATMYHNGGLPDFAIEPEAPFCFISTKGIYRMTSYAKAKIECGDWKEIPAWGQ